jgi:outer membrane protein assembly factor BamA
MLLLANTEISKIKVIGNEYTKTETILSFFREVEIGENYSKTLLKKRIKRIEERLLRTTWFYDVDIYIMESSKNKNFSNIIVEVKEGFLKRYWGGSIYAGFGYANLGGSGKYIAGELGLNRQKIYYSDPLFFHKNLALDFATGISEKENVIENSEDIEYKELELYLAYQFPYDNHLGVDISLNKNELSGDDINSKIGFRYLNDTRDDFFSSNNGHYFNAFIGKSDQFDLEHYEFDYRYFFPLSEDITYAVRFRYDKQSKEDSNFYDFYSLNGLNGVRSAEGDNLYGNKIKSFHSEVRFDTFKKSLFNTLTINTESLLFLDAGCAELNGKIEEAYAYGFGFRFFLDKPVYLPIRLELGFDREERATLFFGIEKPF